MWVVNQLLNPDMKLLMQGVVDYCVAVGRTVTVTVRQGDVCNQVVGWQ